MALNGFLKLNRKRKIIISLRSPQNMFAFIPAHYGLTAYPFFCYLRSQDGQRDAADGNGGSSEIQGLQMPGERYKLYL